MPKPSSGIGRGKGRSVKRGVKAQGNREAEIIDASRYEAPVIYENTKSRELVFTEEKYGPVTDRRTGKSGYLREALPENAGYKAVRKAPLGSIVKIEIPSGVINDKQPAREEYFEIVEGHPSAAAQSIVRQLKILHTTDPNGWFSSGGEAQYSPTLWGENVFYSMARKGSYEDISNMGTWKSLNARFKYAERISLYYPKKK